MEDSRGKKVISNIKENYRHLETSIVEQLYMVQKIHGTTIGSAREDIWKELFEMLIPQKFVIEHSVFIIDSKGNVSKEVDLAIMDQTYTPYIFKFGRVKFIPIEAVAVVIECKSQDLKQESLIAWSEAIEYLRTSTNSITRLAQGIVVNGSTKTQKSTRPIRILCALQGSIDDSIKRKFDFVMMADAKHKRIKIEEGQEERKKLDVWYKELNFYDRSDETDGIDGIKELKKYTLENYVVHDKGKENTLLSFNFQLNQILMLINNPILFPHLSYVELFNQNEENEENNEILEEKEEVESDHNSKKK